MISTIPTKSPWPSQPSHRSTLVASMNISTSTPARSGQRCGNDKLFQTMGKPQDHDNLTTINGDLMVNFMG